MYNCIQVFKIEKLVFKLRQSNLITLKELNLLIYIRMLFRANADYINVINKVRI